MPLTESEFAGFYQDFNDEAIIGTGQNAQPVSGLFIREPNESFEGGQFPINTNRLSFQALYSDLASVEVDDTIEYESISYRVVSIENSGNLFIKLYVQKT